MSCKVFKFHPTISLDVKDSKAGAKSVITNDNLHLYQRLTGLENTHHDFAMHFLLKLPMLKLSPHHILHLSLFS